jgi:oxygen-independent coproporphyrinogen-3 oxidase
MKTAIQKEKLGVYIHVPFCKSKCAYCDFYSLPHADERMDDYEKAILAHLTETAPRAEHHIVDTVYFGGGTPTLLGAKRLKELLSAVQKKYSVARDAEITFEANPDSACDWKELRALRRAGFNRISLGMQSACNEELSEIGRVHTFEQVKEAVEAAQKAKIENLSLDLIYGLPHQTMERWKANLEAAVSLAPKHISCYGLKVEEGTPLFVRKNSADLPGDDEQAEMYLYTVDCLRHYGYFQYEISNFARPGYESRHNLKYWTLGEYAGFGPGAHSDFGGVRYAYVRDLDGYIRGVLENAPMLSENERIPPLARDTEFLMLGLRTVQGLDPQIFERRYRRRFDCFLPFLEQCREAGYALREDSGCWHLTPRGFLVSNRIIGEMLDVLGADKQRKADAAARGDFRIQTD